MPKPNPEINISLTFRHTDSTDALKNYVTEKITQCIKKYTSYNVELRVVLSVIKLDHSAEVHLHTKRFDISAKATTADLYSAIDKVVDNLDAQLRKQKERTIQHKQPSAVL